MKYTVFYSRKVKAGLSYEMLEIGASAESDSGVEPMDMAFGRLRCFVDHYIDVERDRLIKERVKRPEPGKKGD